MSFLDLPDLALLNIFDSLPVKKLLNKQLVCRRWYKLIRAGCLRRQSLGLLNDQRLTSSNSSYPSWFPNQSGVKNFTNDGLIADYLATTGSAASNFNHLSLPASPTQESLTELINLFANLSRLEITINSSVADLEAAVFFLCNNSRLRNKLTRLKFKFALQPTIPFFSSSPESTSSEQLKLAFTWLFNAIDNLQCLQSLSLELDVYPQVDYRLPLHYMPLGFLNRQLEHLHFSSTSSQLTHHLINRLLHVGTLPKSISVATNSTMSSFLGYPQQAALWFTKINILVTPFHDELSTFVQVHEIFCNITTLSLGIITICQFNNVALPQLAKLCRLKQVTLHIVDNHQNLPVVTEPLPVLSSVQALRLTACLPTHEYMGAFHLPHVYPNLEVIAFDYFTHRCVLCVPEGVRGNLQQNENCEQLARAYLQECPKLTTIL